MKNIKRIVAMVLALAILVIGASSVALTETDYFKTTSRLYLRMGPGTDYESITCLDKGEKVSYVTESYASDGTEWFEVRRSSGVTGWCCADYLTYAGNKSDTETGKVKLTGDTHIRSAASLSGTSLGVAVRGTSLTYDKAATDNRGVKWYHITYYGTTGWISSRYTKKI